MGITVLLVEPESALRDRVRADFKGTDHRLMSFSSPRDAHAELESIRPDLALLSAGNGPTWDQLETALKQHHKCQIVWIAPEGGELEALVEQRRPRGLATRQELPRMASHIAEQLVARRERSRALIQIPMLGESEVMKDITSLIDNIAHSQATSVLILGESGTGKELAARRLHAESPRAGDPFVEVDCASIPGDLMESTLFGHEPGAFTDARESQMGLLELAQDGTVFLDEIGELTLGLQSKLLRVLDSRRFRRLGAHREIHLNAQVVAATNRDLAAEVDRGTFRADLFYRLDVVRVELPPLRTRGKDILLLGHRFFSEARRRLGYSSAEFSLEVQQAFLNHDWPGNVRELKNHMERAALALPPEEEWLRDSGLDETAGPRGQVSVDFSRGPIAWDAIEEQILSEAMSVAQGNISEAARLLGLGRGALRYRLAKHPTLQKNFRIAA